MDKYELMVVYRPLLVEDIKEKSMTKVEKLVKEAKGTLSVKEVMGKKLLAYPINKFKEGYYVLYNVELASSAVADLNTNLNLMEDVLRFLLIKEDQL